MTETLPNASDKKELPKWDRSAQGINNTIGRIADMLYNRVEKVGNSENELSYKPYIEGSDWDSRDVVMRTLLPGEATNHTTSATPHIEVHTEGHLPDLGHRLVFKKHNSIKGSGSTELTVQTYQDDEDINSGGAEARLHDNGLILGDTSYEAQTPHSKIFNPVMVGEVAANILEKARGRVADAELDAKKESMIDFVNGKQK